MYDQHYVHPGDGLIHKTRLARRLAYRRPGMQILLDPKRGGRCPIKSASNMRAHEQETHPQKQTIKHDPPCFVLAQSQPFDRLAPEREPPSP